MATNTTKVGIGVLLLVVSSALILATGTVNIGLPLVSMSVAALGLAAGALLVGTSEDGRQPV
jgi:hypothetical protein